MKFCTTTGALGLVLVVSVLVQLASAFSSPERLSSGICGMKCNPNSVHGCKGACPVCDPEEAKCIESKNKKTPQPPPKSAKCMVKTKGEQPYGVWIRTEPNEYSPNPGIVPSLTTIEVTAKADGTLNYGSIKWFKLADGRGWVPGGWLIFENGGPAWCNLG